MRHIAKIAWRGLLALDRAAPWLLVAVFWVLSSPLALAAKKKAAEVAPTKSYVVPYMIVLVLVSIGLMTIIRPSRRLDMPPDKKAHEEE